ncbi:alpha/beta hydrolase-fold protein [Streptomyces sp. H10-C2]|uniref:alpha/beta hydrolase n=1 Tax=unclassified Streptomyces TaxID=2593676 RepID=UPI0024BA05AE|nr:MULTISPECIES: alpha/beta hydrolase-fold protein [unclassified Streptomyces]MDJ0340883.1 alpha/beta hydrolase-fold protein [Streptomyces sp. PH10-H1]MDJ0371723.1 alpha/beta hydrolase-fold protein [Streptomyces sp. H10-C2]
MDPRSRRRRPLVLPAAAALLALAALAGCGSGGDPASADSRDHLSASAGAGDGKATPPTESPGASSSKVLMPTGPKSELKLARSTQAGPIMVTSVRGAKSGVTGKVWVWLPPEYSDPKYATYGFPVVMMYAGGQSNGYNTWTDHQLPIQEADVQLSKQGKAHPFIMIMPVQNLNSHENKALDCSDIPGQPKMGTWMARDVPDFVRANFRTLRSRDGWGVMGASTGGFCSAKLVLQYPDVFKAAVPMDGYFDPDSLLWKGHEADRLANSPNTLARKGKADVSILATAGNGEPYETNLVKTWLKKIVAPVKAEYYELPGGRHLTSDFKKLIPRTLTWFTSKLAGPTDGS